MAAGKPRVVMASAATWRNSSEVMPSFTAWRAWECTAPSDRAPTESASLIRRRVRASSGPDSAQALPSAS